MPNMLKSWWCIMLHDAVVVGQVLDLDLADEDVAVEVDDVVAVHRQLQLAVIEADAGGERVAQIALADGPAVGRWSRRAARGVCPGTSV